MKNINKIALLFSLLFISSGCSILHPVMNDYDSYLEKNYGEHHFEKINAGKYYFLTPSTQNHKYEYRSMLVGYAHLWVVEFGKVLDSTMRSREVRNSFGEMMKSDNNSNNDNTLIFDLLSYSFDDYGADIQLSISVVNNNGLQTFKKVYTVQGETQGGKMFWSGPFGMTNAFEQSTKKAMDSILSQFIYDFNIKKVNQANILK